MATGRHQGEFMIGETQMMRNESFLKYRIPDKPLGNGRFSHFFGVRITRAEKKAVMQIATGEQYWMPIVADMTATVT